MISIASSAQFVDALSWRDMNREVEFPTDSGDTGLGEAAGRISIGAHLRGGFWPSCPEERAPSHTTAQNASR